MGPSARHEWQPLMKNGGSAVPRWLARWQRCGNRMPRRQGRIAPWPSLRCNNACRERAGLRWMRSAFVRLQREETDEETDCPRRRVFVRRPVRGGVGAEDRGGVPCGDAVREPGDPCALE